MAPENNVVVSVVRTAVAASQDRALAERAASFLTHSLTQKGREALVDELLGRLAAEKASRESRGLNHWSEYSQEYMARLVATRRGVHRRRVGNYIATHHEWLLSHAFRVTRDMELANRALGRLYIGMLEGKVRLANAVHALTMDCRDQLRLREIERKRFQSLDQMAVAYREKGADATEAAAEVEPADFPSLRKEDRDPLEILIEKEELDAAKDVVRKDWRYRWIKQKEWGKSLEFGA